MTFFLGRRQNQEEKAFSEVHQFIDEGKTESSLTVEPEPKSNVIIFKNFY